MIWLSLACCAAACLWCDIQELHDKKESERLKVFRDGFSREGCIVEKYFTSGRYFFRVFVSHSCCCSSSCFRVLVPESVFESFSVGDIIGLTNLRIYDMTADYSAK